MNKNGNNRQANISETQERENISLDDLISEAKTGSGMACYHLAAIFETGDEKRNIPVDYKEAVYWYKESLKDSYMPAATICQRIALICEEKIKNTLEAWKYYRKAYCLESEDKRPALLAKRKELEPELVGDRITLEEELDELLQQTKLSDDDIRRMAFLIERTQIPVFPEKEIADEEKWIEAVLPKAKIIVQEAFHGDPVSENALGVFYSHGMVLPMDFGKQEYWFGCAYSDGYEQAYENLKGIYKDLNKSDKLINLVIVAARRGNADAQEKCKNAEIDYRTPCPLEWNLLDLYSAESLASNEVSEEQMALIDKFSQTDDVTMQKDILHQLVPATTDYYIDAFLNGEPYPKDSLIDKLMDTDDEKKRRELVKGLRTELAEFALQEIPYMPLTEEERRCVQRFGKKEKRRSPHRSYSYIHRWREISDKGLIISWMMDGDHRLTFETANWIFDRYEKRKEEINAKRQEESKKHRESNDSSEITDDDKLWLELFDEESIYMKRQAFYLMKMIGETITEEGLKQETARLFLNLLKIKLNPVLDPLVIYESKCDYNQVREEFKEKQDSQVAN